MATPIPAQPGTAVSESAGGRLAECLRQLGNEGLLFGEFLSLRADLFNADSLLALQKLPAPACWQPGPGEVASLLAALRPAQSADEPALTQQAISLEPVPIRETSFRSYFCLHFADGTEAIAQVARPPLLGDREFARFETQLKKRRGALPADVFAGRTLEQFRRWLVAGSSFEAERRLLEAIAQLAPRGVTQFPRPVAGLCSDRVLVYRPIQGESVKRLYADGQREALHKVAESLLEQACLFAVVPADLDLDNYVITPGGAVGLRFSGRFIPVPGPASRHLLKYLSSAIAGNVPVSAHALLQLAGGKETQAQEAMLAELAAMEPDLRANLPYPPSATLLESQWRALERLEIARPLYVDCLHRNISSLCYWYSRRNGDAGAPSPDLIEESYWPVLGSLWRRQLGELATREGMSDWLVGSGLLMAESLRQMSQIAEDFRDGALTVRVNLSDTRPAPSQRSRGAASGATGRTFGAGAMLLAGLLVLIRNAVAATGTGAVWAAAGAAVCLVGLVVLIIGLED